MACKNLINQSAVGPNKRRNGRRRALCSTNLSGTSFATHLSDTCNTLIARGQIMFALDAREDVYFWKYENWQIKNEKMPVSRQINL